MKVICRFPFSLCIELKQCIWLVGLAYTKKKTWWIHVERKRLGINGTITTSWSSGCQGFFNELDGYIIAIQSFPTLSKTQH
jgi:hypothetical protein